MCYDYYDPSDDPRFKEDLKVTVDTNQDDIEEDSRLEDSRNEDLVEREADARNEELLKAYDLLREVMDYNEFRELQGELRAGHISNEDILKMAKNEAFRR